MNSVQTLRNTASESQTTDLKCETLISYAPYLDGADKITNEVY
jgi:hypothetical protein